MASAAGAVEALFSRCCCCCGAIGWPWARAARHGGCGTMVSLRWHEARHSSYWHGVHCHGSTSHVTGVQWLAVQLLHWPDAHHLALHQRRKMRGILSLGGGSCTAPRWVDTAVQLAWLRFGVRQWSWQLRWRAFGCAERCRSSQQHRSSHGTVLDVFVCLRALRRTQL